MERNLFWDKFRNYSDVSYNDIENYIYTREYLKSIDDLNFNYDGAEYNNNLYKYYYETEAYTSENDYKEIFFQDYIDGNISKYEYYKHEKSFIDFMNFLSIRSKVFAFYSSELDIENSFPYKKSKDILFDLNLINDSKGKIISLDDNFFRQLCYLTAREIETVIFIFPDIKGIVLNSGLHGLLILENPISVNLKIELSKVINFNCIDN